MTNTPTDIETDDGVPTTAKGWVGEDTWPSNAEPDPDAPAVAGCTTTIYKAEGRHGVADQGKFVIHFHFPGYLLPEPTDHGYYGLAAVAESFMAPDTWIRLHEHRNDEIISWVPAGVMRHNDRTVGELVTDADHLMVMNAGRSFWHEEQTHAGDPPLRMLQIFVRPHTADLEPGIQHGPIPAPVTGEWRHLFGPDGSEAPFTVRNGVHLYDVQLDDGDAASLPEVAGWHTFFHVFEGEVLVDGVRFGQGQSGLIPGPGGQPVTANQPATLVAFLIDPAATVTKTGTVGR